MSYPLRLCLLVLISLGPSADSAKPFCKICKEFVESFNKVFKETSMSNYAGGDTSWEEEKLGSYSDSEVRLVEILDSVCSRSDFDCHRLLEDVEEDVERWWFKLRKQGKHRDLHDWLCLSHLGVCCPDNMFGPTCKHCPGGPDMVCGGRGVCEGAGEKDGLGECICDSGYTGDMCQSCDSRYYLDKDTKSTNPECKACDKSCDKSCNGPGAGDCDACGEGYTESEDGMCEDVDECKIDVDTRCKAGKYCFNTPGRYQCNACDKSCDKICNGPGPAKCADCASGYTRNENGVCLDDDECTSGLASCKDGTYCENSPGRYVCKACHIACLGNCFGAGASGCAACKEGYSMNVEEGCKDVDECEADPIPCHSETEVCSNLVGTYVCNCVDELVRGVDGECVTKEERRRQKYSKKEKKKKKRRIRKAERPGEPEEEGRGLEREEVKVMDEKINEPQHVDPMVDVTMLRKNDEFFDEALSPGDDDVDNWRESVDVHGNEVPVTDILIDEQKDDVGKEEMSHVGVGNTDTMKDYVKSENDEGPTKEDFFVQDKGPADSDMGKDVGVINELPLTGDSSDVHEEL